MLGDENGVVESQYADPGADADGFGFAGDVVGEGQGLGHDAEAGEVVFGQPHRIKSQLLSVLDLLNGFAKDAGLLRSVGIRP